ncbi:ribonuclease E/G [Clostridium sp. AM27-31LB]|uniref:ribonuclease E/G n=1 Tax=Clostridia TaxID=186801 RepID=UPI000E4771C8|nr:ribonuclease E/G [Clostridium sp. AM27-31LB]RHT95204.1 ribonuclease E/G [Clostridium sp. AM27-31LB]
MANQLLITKKDGAVLSVRVEDGKVAQIQAQPEDAGSLLGDIYVGKVRNIVKNINAAFVEYEQGKMGYLSLDAKVCPIHTDGVVSDGTRVLIGDEIIVQIEREAVKTKPPTLSGTLNFPGKYVVLIYGEKTVSISSKIKDAERKQQLREFLRNNIDGDYGFVARTNCKDASDEKILKEIAFLKQQLENIKKFGVHRAKFNCLYHAPDAYLCDIRDSYDSLLESIITDDDEIFNRIMEFAKIYQPEDIKKIKRWDNADGKLDAVYDVTKTLEHALMPKVWLKNGGYLVIQPTEALVSIDVNTGKAISKKKDVQKTFLKVNLEAATQIAKQLRLRNLSGMILIDFIDMKDADYNKQLMDRLRTEFAKDPVKTILVDMTKLGLVEVTRKKVRKSLYEQIKDAQDYSKSDL